MSQNEQRSAGAQRPRSSQRRERSRRVVHLLLLSFAAVMLVDAIVGEQGVVALARARQELRGLTAQVQRLKTENTVLRTQNRRLREDQDALEEAARRDLGLMKPGEKVFIIKDLPSPPHP